MTQSPHSSIRWLPHKVREAIGLPDKKPKSTGWFGFPEKHLGLMAAGETQLLWSGGKIPARIVPSIFRGYMAARCDIESIFGLSTQAEPDHGEAHRPILG
jgi:hypothetical protein